MTYVFLDTCIYNRIVTQGQPGSTVECFEELKKLAQEGKVRAIVPEVVVLEFEKFSEGLDNEWSAAIDKLKKEVADACAKKQWNEIAAVRESIIPHIETEAAKEKAAFPDRIKAVKEWLGLASAATVPFDSEIWLKAKRRLMSGRFPPQEPPSEQAKKDNRTKDDKKDQDAAIIESVLKVLPTGEKLYFCSENVKDFGLAVRDKGNERHILHPLLAKELPNTTYFTDLCSLVEAIKSGKEPPLPTAEEVEKAVEVAAVISETDRFAGYGPSSEAQGVVGIESEGAIESVSMRKKRRFLFLKYLYETTGGSTMQYVAEEEIGKALGCTPDELEEPSLYLRGARLITGVSGPKVALTHRGVVEVEAAVGK